MYCELTSKGKWPQSMPQAFNFWKVEPVCYYIYAWPIRKNYKESTPAEHINHLLMQNTPQWYLYAKCHGTSFLQNYVEHVT